MNTPLFLKKIKWGKKKELNQSWSLPVWNLQMAGDKKKKSLPAVPMRQFTATNIIYND